MKIDQVLVLIYTLVGIFLGFLTNYFLKSNLDLSYALIIPILIYFVSFYPLIRLVKSKKRRWLFSQSFITFILVWLIVWITLYNL